MVALPSFIIKRSFMFPESSSFPTRRRSPESRDGQLREKLLRYAAACVEASHAPDRDFQTAQKTYLSAVRAMAEFIARHSDQGDPGYVTTWQKAFSALREVEAERRRADTGRLETRDLEIRDDAKSYMFDIGQAMAELASERFLEADRRRGYDDLEPMF